MGKILAARTALALGALALGLAASPLAAQRSPGWAHERSDLPVNPAVRFGSLPNGMRYAIMRNTTPAGTVAMRLRFDVGSLHERDDQWGFAHFLEHMTFRGTTHVPSGEQRNMLERLGLQFGADTNAVTSFLDTVYRFDIPSADSAKIDTALMLMRETASEALLTDESFQAERPVILGEERLGANVGRDGAVERLKLLFAGQPVSTHLPIGTPEVLQAAKPEQLRQFYRTYYRPERATMVVVGDLDPADVEAKIKARFTDWKNDTPPPGEPALGTPQAKGPAVRIFSKPDAQPGISLAWLRPFDTSPYDKARFRRDMVERLAMNILSRRLFALASSGTSPFAGAGAGVENSLRSSRMTTMSASIMPDDWQRALTALIVAQRQITASAGVSQADLDLAITATRAALQTRAASQPTRPSQALANELVNVVERDDVFTLDAYDLQLFEEVVKQITAEEVAASARAAFAGAGPLIFISTPKPIEGGETAVLAALAEAGKVSTSALPANARAWPYTSFGTPAAVTQRRRVEDLDITEVRFANGVRLSVKPTKLVQDQVLIAVRFGQGKAILPKDRPSPYWAVSTWLGGGLKGLSLAEQQQIFAGKIRGEAALAGDDAFFMSAQTRPVDFELELQLLTAYAIAPAWRPEAFERMRTVLGGSLPQMGSSPTAVMGRDLARLLHSGDMRWGTPSLAEVQATTADQVRGLIDPALASGAMEIAIVGDITVDRAIEAVGATFGTLAPRAEPSRRLPRVSFPKITREPVTLRHSGRADQGLALAAWPLPDYYSDPRLALTMDVVAQVVSHRLFDQVRVAQGATYTTRASAESSRTLPGYGFFLAYAEVPPEKVQGFQDTLSAIIADLKAKDVTADELTRAVRPALENLATARRGNAYWLGRMTGSQAEPRQLDIIRTEEEVLRRLTPTDLRRAAERHLDARKAWRLRILPNQGTAAK